MKIVFLVNYDIYACRVLAGLSTLLSKHDITVIYTEAVRVYETPLDDLAALETTLFRESSRFMDRSKFRTMPYSARFYEDVRDIAPDFIVSLRFSKRLHDPVIEIPRFGILNYHSGLLPQYKGVMATFWSMLRQDSIYGWTAHYITDSRLDCGPIVHQKSFPLSRNQSYFKNVLSLYPSIADHLNTLLGDSDLGIIGSLPQQGDGLYFSFPGRDDVLAFESQGGVLYTEAELAAVTTFKDLY